MRLSPIAVLAAITAALIWPGRAAAVDVKGAHRTRGVGHYSCAQFVDAKSTDIGLYRSFGGWIDGFVSAVNFYEERTFDIAPWQTTDMLAEGLSAYCQRTPNLPFEEAVKRLVEDLSAQRLVVASKLIIIEDEQAGQGIRLPVYKAIIERMQRRLQLLGYYDAKVTREFDTPTKEALTVFQKRAGRPQTGLPDQVTLLLLFDQNAAALPR